MTNARKEIRDIEVEQVFHCVTRCVRRAFLCGKDDYSGKSFEHRRGWVRERLKLLAGVFSIDICGYAVMSNHLHVILRSRPDMEKTWSDKEVAKRWLRVFPPSKGGKVRKVTAEDVQALAEDVLRINKLRERFRDISWFMKCLDEYIARKANGEDECKGHFWEGRFKCQALEEEASVLLVSTYVDLNPIRSKMEQTPEESEFTSVFDRIQSRQARRKIKKLREQEQEKGHLTPAQRRLILEEKSKLGEDRWLCPLGESRIPELHTKEKGARKAFLSIGFERYLELLEWTGRQIRFGKKGKIPDHLMPIFDRLEIDAEKWLEAVRHFGQWFYRVVGRISILVKRAKKIGRSWLRGQEKCRQVFAS